MAIWNDILKGCETTQQAHGMLCNHMDGVDFTCALGAAYLARFGSAMPDIPLLDQYKVWHELDAQFICPEPGCGHKLSDGYRFIVHLNDIHEWKRESIAFYLRDILSPKSEVKLFADMVTA